MFINKVGETIGGGGDDGVIFVVVIIVVVVVVDTFLILVLGGMLPSIDGIYWSFFRMPSRSCSTMKPRRQRSIRS